MNKCQGQGSRNRQAENIICINCGYAAEIFSDEVKIKCPACANLISRQRLPSCVDWCKAARDCMGEEKWNELKGGAQCFVINANKQ